MGAHDFPLNPAAHKRSAFFKASLSYPTIIVPLTSVTGTPNCPDLSNISFLAFSSKPTFASEYLTLFSLKNSFVFMHHWHVLVVYILTLNFFAVFFDDFFAMISPQ